MTYKGPTTGERNTLLTLQSAQRVLASDGQPTTTWMTYATAWGRRRPFGVAAERYVDQQIRAETTYTFEIPYVRKVQKTDRVVVGSVVYEVKGVVDPDDRRAFLILYCREAV